MGKKRGNIKAVFRFELDSSYQFPVIALLVSVFLVVGIYSTLNHISIDAHISSGTTDILDRAEHLSDLIFNKGLAVLTASLSNSVFLFIILIPLLVGFNFAQGYKNGLIRTMLTYPIDRKLFIVIKSCTLVLIMASVASIGSIASVIFFIPTVNQLELVVLSIASLWVLVLLMVSVSILVAVISKNPLATSFGGIAIWFLAFITATGPDTSNLVKVILFPPFAVGEYTGTVWWGIYFQTEFVLNEILLGMGVGCLLSIVLLSLSWFIFRRTGV